jgi:hypothetical protein
MTEECLHILQFCHLCHIGKMPPVIFSADSSIEAKAWQSSILTSAERPPSLKETHSKHCMDEKESEKESSDDESISQPATKIL